jgi:uncharacterized protein
LFYHRKMKLSAINIFPIKSTAAVSLSTAQVIARGLQDDRRWMIVDEAGNFLTGRQLPTMVLIHAMPIENGLLLTAPGMPEQHVETPAAKAQRMLVKVWNDQLSAALADANTDAWLSHFLARDVRLVFMDALSERKVEVPPPHAAAIHDVSFADGYPLLLISEASLAGLNKKLAAPISMLRFRPNLVVSADQPHAEDSWQAIRIGEVAFDLVKTCTRCVFTTVEPLTGIKDPSNEPLNTLKTYRRSKEGIIFGMNLVAKNTGNISIHDDVTVLLR